MKPLSRLSHCPHFLLAYGVRLSIAAPLGVALFSASSIASAIAPPSNPDRLLPIAQNQSEHQSKASGVSAPSTPSKSSGHNEHSDPSERERHNPHSMGDGESNEHHSHGHSSLEVDASQSIPQVSIAIQVDSVSGWNLEITTTDFELTGATVGQASSFTQGHAHLYANGEKIARVYGNWYHIPHLPSGDVVVEVVLNSNQHQTLTHNGLPIAASTVVTVP